MKIRKHRLSIPRWNSMQWWESKYKRGRAIQHFPYGAQLAVTSRRTTIQKHPFDQASTSNYTRLPLPSLFPSHSPIHSRLPIQSPCLLPLPILPPMAKAGAKSLLPSPARTPHCRRRSVSSSTLTGTGHRQDKAARPMEAVVERNMGKPV